MKTKTTIGYFVCDAVPNHEEYCPSREQGIDKEPTMLRNSDIFPGII